MPPWKQVRAILMPIIVALVIPAILVGLTGDLNPGWSLPAPFQPVPVLLGALTVGVGLILFSQTLRLFISVGRGTLAPWDPPRRVVVHGIYRHVRNPMITGVCCVLLGEGMALGSGVLLSWLVTVGVVNAIYIPLVEEPRLEQRFGEDYRDYCRHVPRWLPRRVPWQPG